MLRFMKASHGMACLARNLDERIRDEAVGHQYATHSRITPAKDLAALVISKFAAKHLAAAAPMAWRSAGVRSARFAAQGVHHAKNAQGTVGFGSRGLATLGVPQLVGFGDGKQFVSRMESGEVVTWATVQKAELPEINIAKAQQRTKRQVPAPAF